MTMIFAIIAAVAVIAFGVLLMFHLRERRYNHFAVAACHHLRLQNDKVRKQRDAYKRSDELSHQRYVAATKAHTTDMGMIRDEIRRVNRHASNMQTFHLQNEHDLRKELFGAHAVIELLLATFPKDYSITPVPYEVQRIFTPVVEMDQHRPMSKPAQQLLA